MGEFSDQADVREMRLDGNAATGLLSELFHGEPSEAIIVCAGCGTTGPIGGLLAYGLEMGAVLRCSRCGLAVLRVGVIRETRWIDLRGAACLRLTPGR